MIAPIGDLVSHCFYGDKLNSPIDSHGLKLSAALPKPVTWYSTHNLRNRAEIPEESTFKNPIEVGEVRKILLRLEFVAKAQGRKISVAVLSGYTAQVRLLFEMVSQGIAEWPSLEVSCNSVDAFQGSPGRYLHLLCSALKQRQRTRIFARAAAAKCGPFSGQERAGHYRRQLFLSAYSRQKSI